MQEIETGEEEMRQQMTRNIREKKKNPWEQQCWFCSSLTVRKRGPMKNVRLAARSEEER